MATHSNVMVLDVTNITFIYLLAKCQLHMVKRIESYELEKNDGSNGTYDKFTHKRILSYKSLKTNHCSDSRGDNFSYLYWIETFHTR